MNRKAKISVAILLLSVTGCATSPPKDDCPEPIPRPLQRELCGDPSPLGPGFHPWFFNMPAHPPPIRVL